MTLWCKAESGGANKHKYIFCGYLNWFCLGDTESDGFQDEDEDYDGDGLTHDGIVSKFIFPFP